MWNKIKQRKIFYLIVSFALLAVVGSFILLFGLLTKSFSDGTNAVDVIGQYDGATYPNLVVDFTKNGANNTSDALGFNSPTSQVLDEVNHRLFVVDGQNNRVLVFNLTTGNLLEDHIADYVLGQENFRTSVGNTTPNSFNVPYAVAYDSVGNRLFVADYNNNRVLVFDVSSITNGENAEHVLGQADFVSNSSATTKSSLFGPYDLYYDNTNNYLYVVDSSNHRVMIFDVASVADGEDAIDVIGQYDETSVLNPVGIFTTSRINNAPNRLGFDFSSGLGSGTLIDSVNHRIFLTDSNNNRILVFNLTVDDLLIDHIPDYVLGQNNFYENTSGLTQSKFNYPVGLGFDPSSNLLFVSDFNNSRILIFDTASITDGEDAVNVLGQDDFTTSITDTTQSKLNGVRGLAFDDTNNLLFVADDNNNRVLIFDTTSVSNGENAVYVLGQSDFISSAGATTANGMLNPADVSFDDDNNRLFVADTSNTRVTVFDTTTIVNGEDAVNVLGQVDFISGGSGGTAGNFDGPRSLSYDSVNNRLFVSDYNNYRVTIFDTAVISNGEDAVHVLGQSDFGSNTAGATQSKFNQGYGGLSYSNISKHLYLVDINNFRVMIFDVDSVSNGENAVNVLGQYDETDYNDPVPIYTTSRINNSTNRIGLNNPLGVEMDEVNHKLFISDAGNNRILIFNLAVDNTLLDKIPDNVFGQNNFYENQSNITQSTLNYPSGLVHDETNNRLFVSDLYNNRVMVFDTTTITDGENATKVLGQTLFTENSANLTQSGFSVPAGIDFGESTNQLFVTDNNNQRIMIFDATSITDGENAVDLLGQYDETNYADPVPIYTTARVNNAPNRIGLNTALGQTIDYVNHRLFIADSNNHRVLVYNLDSSDQLVDYIPEYVLGQENFYTNDEISDQDSLGYPIGLAYDPVNDRLFVSERNNSRVTVFDTASITNGEDAIYVLGQPNFTTSSHGTTSSKFYQPHYIDYDSVNNRLFVGDTHNRRVLIFDTTTISNGESAVNVIGQDLFTTAQVGTSATRFNLVTGVVYDSTNNRLFVGDYNNHRVMVFDVASISNGEAAVNVLGQVNFTSNINALDQDNFDTRVFGVAYDSTNQRLFATDTDANRVLVFDVAEIVNGENAVNVIGQANFTSSNTDTTQSSLVIPLGVFYDNANERLYTGEYNYNNRVMVFYVPIGVSGGGGGGGGGGGSNQPGINITHTDGGTSVSENTSDTFYISLKSNITSDVVVSITSSNTSEGTVSPITLTFSNNNWNTPQAVVLTGVSDGLVDGLKSYNIVVSVIDEFSATSYDGVEDVLISVSTSDSDAQNEDKDSDPDKKTDGEDGGGDKKGDGDSGGGTDSDPDKKTDGEDGGGDKKGDGDSGGGTDSDPDKKTDGEDGGGDKKGDGDSGGSSNKSGEDGEGIFSEIAKIFSGLISGAFAKIVVALGATSAVALGFIRLVFTNPFGITDLAMRGWSMFLYGFGIKKRHKPWGVVFDSITKQPLDPVYLKLVDIEKKVVGTCFTDIDGRYGFLVEPGHYHIIAEKTHYVFPSSKLNSKERDEVYTDLYYGNYIEIKEFGDVITKNIPMDRVGFDWNEYAKLEQNRLRWYKRSDKAVGQIVDIFFLVGFVMSGLTLFGSNIKAYNVIIFAIYGILFAFNHTQFGNYAKGKAMFKEGSPIAYGILRVFSKESGREITHKVIDRLGNYFCLAPNGHYNVSIEQKNPDGSYSKVHSEEGLEITKGYLKKEFKV